MTNGVFGTFSLLWILLNVGFILALVAAAFMLTTWLLRRARTRRQTPPEHLPGANGLSSRFDILRAQFEHGEIDKKQYEKRVEKLKHEVDNR